MWLSSKEVEHFLKELKNEGLISPKEGYWEATARGYAFAMATAAKALRKSTAEQLVADIIGAGRSDMRPRPSNVATLGDRSAPPDLFRPVSGTKSGDKPFGNGWRGNKRNLDAVVGAPEAPD